MPGSENSTASAAADAKAKVSGNDLDKTDKAND
jgi:hypothetical protein